MHHFKKLSIPLGAAALAAALAVPAFAQVEEEIVSGPKSRDQVIAELEQARADGTLAQLQGEHSYAPDFDEARGMDVQYSNHQADADVTVGMSSDTSSEVRFSAPAAGGQDTCPGHGRAGTGSRRRDAGASVERAGVCAGVRGGAFVHSLIAPSDLAPAVTIRSSGPTGTVLA